MYKSEGFLQDLLSSNEDPRESELNSGKRPKIEPWRQIVTYVIAKG